MAQVDLAALTKNEVRMLTGHQRGVHSRSLFQLDALEAANEPIVLVAPRDLDLISPSFVQGLFAATIQRVGEDGLRRIYDFSQLSSFLQQDLEVGIQRLMLHVRRGKAS